MPELEDWLTTGRDRVRPRPERWHRPNWWEVPLRFCRDGTDALAKRLRPVPDSHRILGGVRCMCEAETMLPEYEWVRCTGGCGRVFISDGETVHAARLPT